MNVQDKSPVLDLAKKIRAKYCEVQGIPADQAAQYVAEPFLKDGDAILPLSCVVVLVTREPSPSDPSDAIKVAVSTNIAASPEGQVVETHFLASEFNAGLAEVHCLDADGTLAEGSEAAWELFNKMRRREILATMNDMVEQRKAQQEANDRIQGKADGIVDANGNKLQAGPQSIIVPQGVSESNAGI